MQQNEPKTIKYNIGYSFRKSVPIYDKENPLVRIARIRAPPKQTFLRNDVMLNITEIDPQLYDSYLKNNGQPRWLETSRKIIWIM